MEEFFGFRMRTLVKIFTISAQRGFQVPKQTQTDTFDGVACASGAVQTAQFRALEIIAVQSTSQGCAFCMSVLVGDVRFVRYKPTKTPISAIAVIDYAAENHSDKVIVFFSVGQQLGQPALADHRLACLNPASCEFGLSQRRLA